MLMFRLEVVDRLPAVVRLRTVEVDAGRIVLEDAFRPLHTVDAAVRARTRDVVLEQDDAPFRGADEGPIEVAVDVLLPEFRRILRLVRFAPLRQAELLGAHRDQEVEAVAMVYIHIEGDRPEAVRGVEVSVPLRMMGSAPESLVLVLEQDVTEVVVVS